MTETTTPLPPPSQPRPVRRWLRWLLVASLGLNLLLLGLAAGAILRGPPDRVRAGPALGYYAHALPNPYRRDLGRELRASRGDWAATRDALRDQRLAFAAALTAEPYDQDRVEALLAEEQSFATSLGARARALLAAQIARMDPEARAAFAERLQDSRRRDPQRGR